LDGALEALAALEGEGFGGGDPDRLAGAGVHAGARLAVADPEGAETGDGHAAALGELDLDAVEDAVHGAGASESCRTPGRAGSVPRSPSTTRVSPRLRLDGAAGRVASHRWIEAGHPIIYPPTTPSLAALETLANLAHPTRFGERTIIETDLANDTQTVNIETTLHLREDAPANDPKTNTR